MTCPYIQSIRNLSQLGTHKRMPLALQAQAGYIVILFICTSNLECQNNHKLNWTVPPL